MGHALSYPRPHPKLFPMWASGHEHVTAIVVGKVRYSTTMLHFHLLVGFVCPDVEVLRVSDLLEMFGPPPSHEELQRAKLLVEWRREFFTIFVSHQWLSTQHPDPDGLQLEILKKAVQNIIDGTVTVESDVVSQLRQQLRRFSAKERRQLANAYIWFDWFSIPQIPNSKAELGIQSIPFYVEACQLFVALVPPLRHCAAQQDCDLVSWLSRGRRA